MSAATNLDHLRTFLLVSQMEPKEVGARIKAARLESGLTQDELSQVGSFSVRALQMWEAGSSIPYRNINELSALLRRPADWFLHGEMPEPDAPTPLLEHRLEELAAAVADLASQIENGSRLVERRLSEIERRLPPLTDEQQPTRKGRRAAGTAA